MRLVIDTERCQGHGRCYALHPELFDCDEEGWGLVLVEHPDVPLVEAARQAIEDCPEHAVSLEETASAG